MNEFSNIEKEEVEIFHKKISQNIKKIRKEKNRTQLDLALTIGFNSVTFYTNAENCKKNKHFNLEHIYKISKALEVDICEFFK